MKKGRRGAPFSVLLFLAKLANGADSAAYLRQLGKAKLDDFFFLLNDLLNQLVHFSSVRYVAF